MTTAAKSNTGHESGAGPISQTLELRGDSTQRTRTSTVAFESARTAREPLLGRTLAGKYRIEAKIGAGSMGTVYRARQLALEKTVAVKVLRRDIASDVGAARFRCEALAASRLDHPNSVRIYDFGEEPDGTLYLVMEYVPGRDLFDLLLEEGPLAPKRIGHILGQVLAALAVAHEGGVIHRDLKPENILVLPGTDDNGDPIDVVKVCDFGIATLRDRGNDDGLTMPGLVIGTPDYMSPEQARGEELDARSDLYAVGVILYQMLTGDTPFGSGNPIDIALKQINDPIVPPSRRATVDATLERICMRALEKSREQRYRSAQTMRHELRAALGRPEPPSPDDSQVVLAQSTDTPRRTTLGEAAACEVSAPPAMEAQPETVVSGSAPARPRDRRLAVVLVLAIGAAIVAIVAVAARPRRPREPAAMTESPPTTTTPQVESVTPHAPVETVAPANAAVETPTIAPSPTTAPPPRPTAKKVAQPTATNAPTTSPSSIVSPPQPAPVPAAETAPKAWDVDSPVPPT